jgi:hypothetical protein
MGSAANLTEETPVYRSDKVISTFTKLMTYVNNVVYAGGDVYSEMF